MTKHSGAFSLVKCLYVFVLIVLAIPAFGQDAEYGSASGTDNEWRTTGNWSLNSGTDAEANGYPDADDDVIWQEGGGARSDYAVSTIDEVKSLTVDNNSASLTISGDLTIKGDLIVNNGLVLNVTGRLRVDGSVTIGNGGNLDVTSTGSISISGNFTTGNGADIDFAGNVDIGGNWSTGGGGSTIDITSPSIVTIGGDIDTSNTDVNGSGTVRAATCTDGSGASGVGTGGGITCSDMLLWLPITLGSFEVIPNNNSIALDWETITEEDFDYFSIERSENGLNFYEIGTVPGHGDSNERIQYSYEDESPLFGTSFYRLNAIDYDGSYEKFQILSVEYLPEDLQVLVYPNPASTQNIRLSLGLPKDADLKKVSVYSLSGNHILDQNLNIGNNDLKLTSKLQAGIYLAKVQIDNYQITRRLIIQ
ncbi:MAG: T9SS type A sorting domain-containing protein [Cyclobacteriaceae bacterium]